MGMFSTYGRSSATRGRGRLGLPALAVVMLLVVGCGGGGGGGGSTFIKIPVIEFMPDPVSLTSLDPMDPGSQQQLTVLADQSDVTSSASYASDDPNIATVSAAGVVQATGIGSTMINASFNGGVGSVMVTVTGTPSAITVSSPSGGTTLIRGGETRQLAAAAQFTGSTKTFDITGTVGTTWTSMNPAIATVSATGVVTASGAGSTTITCTNGGVQGTITIDVDLITGITLNPSAPVDLTQGKSFRLQVFANNTAMTDVTAASAGTTYSSNSPIAAVSAGGVVTASTTTTGTAVITATNGNFNSSVQVNVTPAPPVTILSADTVMIGPGTTSVTVPLRLATAIGDSPTSLQFEISLDPALSIGSASSVTAGSATLQAGADLIVNTPTTTSIVAVATNISSPTVFPDGVIAELSLNVDPMTTVGQKAVLVTGFSAVDVRANRITTMTADGAVNVGMLAGNIFEIQTVNATPGSTVTVPITLMREAGAMPTGFQVDLEYAPELSIAGSSSVTLGPAVAQSYLVNSNIQQSSPTQSSILVVDFSGSAPPIGDGVILNIEFTVAATAPANTGLSVRFRSQSLTNRQGTSLPTSSVNGFVRTQ